MTGFSRLLRSAFCALAALTAAETGEDERRKMRDDIMRVLAVDQTPAHASA